MSETVFCKDFVVQEGIRPVSREKVMELERVLVDMQDDVEYRTSHHFAPGVYLRELFIPAGVVMTGAIHRTKHLTIIASGTVKITTGRGVEEITGPAVFVSEIGAKKAVYAITDCVIMNPLPTTETDIEKIEKAFIAPSFEALEHDTAALEQESKL